MSDLKQVYKAPTSERSDNSTGTRTKATAEEALLQLEQKWNKRYPMVINSWINNLAELSAYFEYSEPIRKIIYTTNTIEGFNSDESLFKLVFLTYRGISKKWEKTISNWGEIISQFSIIFEDRLNGYIR